MTVFLGALEQSGPAARAAYLDDVCQGDAEFRRHVEGLLATHPGAAWFAELGAALKVVTPEAAAPGLATTLPPIGGTVAQSQPRSEAATGANGPGGERSAIDPGANARAAGTIVAGRYKLLEPIGEGGMGSVWKADQIEPVKRRVAVKLIRVEQGSSKTILSRFEAERQAIALMDHPHIAKLLDAGTTAGGSPFFVMELVKGVPLNEYCDAHKLNIRERLQLFMQICAAVQHAHQKGVIHRDLKPTNVLVESRDGKPLPKVIDFGLAKAVSGVQLSEHTLFTAFGSVMGTPLYMAPEQATFNAVDIDTRADVYALGVILYELLTGTTPITRESMKQAALDETLRLIREQDAPTPSSRLSSSHLAPSIAANRQMEPQKLNRLVKGELDWIVMKALSKERDRRYETASGFARDIERFLNNEAVAAGPPSTRYRLRKFVKRHRGQVIAASLVVLALVSGMAGTTLGLFEARRQRARADERAEGERLATRKALDAAEEEKAAKETAEAVLGFVEGKVFAAARPKNQGGGLGYDVKLADAVTAALPSIENGFADKPLTEARLRRTIGLSFSYLGKPEIAVGQFDAARSLYSRHLGPEHRDTLNTMSHLAGSYEDLGRHADALKLREETLALQKTALGPDDPDTLWSMNALANSYSTFGRHADVLKLREETLKIDKIKFGRDNPITLQNMMNLANVYRSLGRHAKALELHEETLALKKTRLGADNLETLLSMNNVANSYSAVGRHAEALKLYDETLARRKIKLGPDHHETLWSMNKLALSYSAVGRQADALKLHEETLALRKKRLRPDHPDTLQSMFNVARIYLATGRSREAMPLVEHATSPKDNDAFLTPFLQEAFSRKDTETFLSLAALLAWLGKDARYDAARRQILGFAKGNHDAETVCRAAQAGALRPSTDEEVSNAVLDLGRQAVELNKGACELLALGMAEFRSGRYRAAEDALLSAARGGQNADAARISAFYRAMSLFQQGRKDEARDVAAKAITGMKPLPQDECDIVAGTEALSDLLIQWLAYKEARAMIPFDVVPQPKAAIAKK
jgi:eukaryotic-like serine/threonine-protein kinase